MLHYPAPRAHPSRDATLFDQYYSLSSPPPRTMSSSHSTEEIFKKRYWTSENAGKRSKGTPSPYGHLISKPRCSKERMDTSEGRELIDSLTRSCYLSKRSEVGSLRTLSPHNHVFHRASLSPLDYLSGDSSTSDHSSSSSSIGSPIMPSSRTNNPSESRTPVFIDILPDPTPFELILVSFTWAFFIQAPSLLQLTTSHEGH
ncbi:hypothetical protein P692DRAFT_20936474 [Suillus brevipes Sb2]|nr:hypothetical protein P692DRAFT_20936474 [Suillus brevipes Sb2]